MKKPVFILAILGTMICQTALHTENIPAASLNQTSSPAAVEYESGKNFLNGQGVEKDPAKALEHFQKASELGHIEAPGAIGYFYAAGLGVDKDEVKAAEWFQKGSEKGSPLAKFNLGRFYLDGKGGLSSPEKGLVLMEEAASLGLPEAHLALAEIYFFGDHGQKIDYQKAVPHAKAAAANGEVAAINMLGVMKQSGLGMEEDKKGAETCFRQAAMKGDFKAQSNLGHLLNPESKSRARRIEATAWIILASNQGEMLASRKIVEIEQSLPKNEFQAARSKADELQATIAGAGSN